MILFIRLNLDSKKVYLYQFAGNKEYSYWIQGEQRGIGSKTKWCDKATGFVVDEFPIDEEYIWFCRFLILRE